ncbi:MAG: 50S ribosomal protein L19e [Thaumarchaeota archaeon]|nr:50S ribosomal protein L19e [Nitrososphaerota archaeon]
MADLRAKRRMAADMLGVGETRIRLDPAETERLEDAITRGSIRSLIKEGVIWVKQRRGVSRGRVRVRHQKAKIRGRGAGSKEGKKYAQLPRKKAWVTRVRALRRRLKIKKAKGEIDNDVFWQIYRQIGEGRVGTIKRMEELIAAIGGK